MTLTPSIKKAVTATTLALATVLATLTPAAGVGADARTPDCRVVTSTDAHRSLTGNAAAVERLYRALFLRSPEDQGLRYWTRVLDAGRADLVEVADRFASSPEFTRRYGSLTDDRFVEMLYCNVFGRIDNSSGSAYWRAEMAGGLSRAEVVLYFSQSDEFARRSVTAPARNRRSQRTVTAPTSTSLPAPSTSSPTTSTTTTAPSTSSPATSTTTTALITTTSTTPSTTTEHESAARLVWADEFDHLDATVWRREHSTYGDGNNELQCYRPENVGVRNGALVLTAKRETYTCPNGSVRDVTSGMVRGSVRFDHGQRIEFRVKVNPNDPDDQRGLWPALWASSWNGGGWPNGGEFDWMEYVGKEPTRSHFTIHYANTDGDKDKIPKAHDLGERFSDSWHTIAFDWTDDLVWYLDGREVQRITAADVDAANNPFLESANTVTQIKLNFALGGTWGGALGPDTIDATGSTTFVIDYVRIYDLG